MMKSLFITGGGRRRSRRQKRLIRSGSGRKRMSTSSFAELDSFAGAHGDPLKLDSVAFGWGARTSRSHVVVRTGRVVAMRSTGAFAARRRPDEARQKNEDEEEQKSAGNGMQRFSDACDVILSFRAGAAPAAARGKYHPAKESARKDRFKALVPQNATVFPSAFRP
jgi:hypothetical protein